MAKEEKSNQLLALKSLFEGGHIKQMRDIEEIFPTYISKTLRLNHSRYIQKLYKPEEFTLKQIFELAYLLEIQPQLIFDVIVRQQLKAKNIRPKM